MTSKIKDMFADAIEYAESNDEFSADIFSKENLNKKVEAAPVEVAPVEVKTEPEITPVETKPVVEEVVEPVVEEVAETVVEFKSTMKQAVEPITLIERTLKLNEFYQAYGENSNMQAHITQYLAPEEGLHQVIYAAIDIAPEQAKALDVIVQAKKFEGADRAFYLITQAEDSLKTISNELDGLVGLDDDMPSVSNKIEFCRSLENTIDKMPDEIIEIIEEISKFINIAKGE